MDAARAGTYGGPGRGQGVKAVDGVTSLKRVNVTLDDASIATLRALGDGELSLGIRRAANALGRGRQDKSMLVYRHGADGKAESRIFPQAH